MPIGKTASSIGDARVIINECAYMMWVRHWCYYSFRILIFSALVQRGAKLKIQRETLERRQG